MRTLVFRIEISIDSYTYNRLQAGMALSKGEATMNSGKSSEN